MRSSLVWLLLVHRATAALNVDLTSSASIKQAARQVADNLLTYYPGNEPGETPGILPGPPPSGDYYWWEAGVLWASLINYGHFTGDSAFVDVTKQGLLFQVGPHNDYVTPNWTASLGNDDQGYWGMAVMLAAETGFQNPASDQPQWLAIAQAVVETMAPRVDETCGGGLRWQIPFSNQGYDYKNSISSGVMFNLAARLGRFTGNTTYADLASKTWDWMVGVGFMTADYDVYDGAHVENNCTDMNKAQFSVYAGIFLHGAAFMYNQTTGTTQTLWKTRVDGLLSRILEVFFPNSVPVEVACELATKLTCTTDMLAFKGIAIQWMTSVAQVAPYTHDTIVPVLKSTAAAAAKSCDGPVCGFHWATGKYDGVTGAGQQMNMLAVLSGLLLDEAGVQGPATAGTPSGGTPTGAAPPGGTPSKTAAPNLGSLSGGSAAGGAVVAVLGAVSLAFWTCVL